MARQSRIFVLLIFLLAVGMPAIAQNTKGDKPSTSREGRFVKGGKKKTSTKKNTDRAARPVTKLRNTDPEKGPSTRARRTRRVTPRSSSGRIRNVYPQSGRFVHNPSKRPRDDGERAAARTAAARSKRIQPKSSASGRAQNIYPQKGRFVNNPSPSPRTRQQPVSNKPALARLKRSQGRSRPYSPGKSINIMARYPRPKGRGEKAYTRDIAGRRLRQRNFESPRPQVSPSQNGSRRSISGKQKSGRSRQEYGRFRNFSSGGTVSSSRRIRSSPRSVSGSGKVYPQKGRFVNNPSPKPRESESAQPNDGALRRVRALLSSDKRPRTQKVVPRSASRSFIARKSTNTWAHFPRPKKRGEQAVMRDIAGKRLRTKNFETPPRPVLAPTFKPYQGRKRVGDRAYKGPAAGTYGTATRSGRAWSGDIAGRKVRGIKKPRLNQRVGEQRGGHVSGTIHAEKKPLLGPLLGKAPGFRALSGLDRYRGNVSRRRGFADQGEQFSGFIKRRRSAKGGGSVSGKLWNNNGMAIQPRQPGDARAALYQGNLKRGRPAKGGGSVSGKLWNNNGSPIQPRQPGDARAALYQGNIKRGRPAKGGGSVSGKLWNNNGSPIQPKRVGDSRLALYQGNIKRGRPSRGASAREVDGYPGKMKLFGSQPGFADQGEEYTGHIKARRPLKGGGSVSGKLWNNNESPIAVRTPRTGANVAAYQGTIKAKRPAKGGGSVSGKLWNNNEQPIAVRVPGAQASKMQGYSGTLRASRRSYIKNPNSSDMALKKHRPSRSVFQEGELQVKVKQFQYVRNNSSASQSLKVREPGRAFAKATDFQGNIKMQKFKLYERNRELHPDARFVKSNKNNVAEERDILTNFKLWWARLFNKNDTQPDHLKDKSQKPRYDKGEAGLWYD